MIWVMYLGIITGILIMCMWKYNLIKSLKYPKPTVQERPIGARPIERNPKRKYRVIGYQDGTPNKVIMFEDEKMPHIIFSERDKLMLKQGEEIKSKELI